MSVVSDSRPTGMEAMLRDALVGPDEKFNLSLIIEEAIIPL